MNLERELRDLDVAFPETPDLAGRVEARLAASAPRRTAPRLRVAWAAAALVVAVTAVLAIPPARDAVADLLGIGRVRVETVPELPAVGTGLDLGEAVTPAEAQAAAAVEVVAPAELGPPDAAYVGADGGVTLAWAPGPGLPEVAGTGVGALLSVLPAEGFFITKQATGETALRDVSVAGRPGLWLEGGPHVVFVEPRPGEAVETRGRLAGNTLLWEGSDVTLRFEADVDLETALRIANSVG